LIDDFRDGKIPGVVSYLDHVDRVVMLTFLFVLFFGAFIVFAAAVVGVIWLMTMFVVVALRITVALVGAVLRAVLGEP
jgi:hypothetical protein